MQRWASIAVLAAVAGIVVPLFAGVVNAASDVPADKQAVLDAQPSVGASDPDDTVDGGQSPVKPAVADTGSSADVAAIKTAVTSAQTKFNAVQMLSPDRATRIQQAQTIANDVTAAADLGVATFVAQAKAAAAGSKQSGSAAAAAPVTDFRIKMVQVFDSSVVLDESVDLAGQLLDDALSTDVPSMVQTSFSTVGWQGVRVDGNTATALVVGSYANCFRGGAFSTSECQTAADMQWQMTLRRGSDGIWRLTERVGVSVDPSPVIEESGPAPSDDPEVDPEPTPTTTESTPEVPDDPTPTKTPKPSWTVE